MNPNLVDDLLKVLKPTLKSPAHAKRFLNRYWRNKIALVWTTLDVHRAANEIKAVLTEAQAQQILENLERHYNPQYGIHWRDLSEIIRDSGKGRDITRAELNRFVLQNKVAVQK